VPPDTRQSRPATRPGGERRAAGRQLDASQSLPDHPVPTGKPCAAGPTARAYADSARTYLRRGWGPLPLPPNRKAPPPAGWTGYGAAQPSGADVADWADNGHASGNVALRLPETVLGIDVDAYSGKPGAATLADAVGRLGELPATWISTSRDDGVSGIRFYRVPAGRCWADVVGPGVELVHHGHRYAVAAPSVHPEGRPYRWVTPDGQQVPGPAVDDLPELPPAWVAELDRGAVADRVRKAEMSSTGVSEVLAELPAGQPCAYVTRVLDDALAELGTSASRHDATNRHVGRLVRAGEQGHEGARAALGTLHDAFRSAVDLDPHRPVDPAEWHRSVSGAVALVQTTPTAEADRGCCGHRLDEQVPSDLPPADDQADAGMPRQAGGKKAAATVLVELALARYRLGVSEGGEPFAVAHDVPHLARLLRGGQGSLRAELAGAYYTATGKAAPAQALADALLVLEGEALHAAPERLYLRVAEADGALWVDLGDPAVTVARVTAAGWQIAQSVPVLFHRTALTGVLPTPADRGDLAGLWRLVNVAPEYRPVLAACLVAALFPDLAHPVVALLGEQGTGKTTASRLLAGLLDPSPAQTRKAPRDVEGWVTAAAGSWLVALDNLSTIQDWLSDALCRAVTGDADVRRRLYTDGDLAVFAFRRVVIVNGIDLGAVRDDLADRLVAVHLTPISERDRMLDADLARAWQAEHPAILAGLLNLAAAVLRRLPQTRLDGLPRMADFARVLAAVDAELGTDGLATYLGLREELAEDAVAGDPVLARLAETVQGEWIGTAADLLDYLTPTELGWKPGRDWPRNARAMTGLLRRRAPSLRRVGWTVDELDEKHPRQRSALWRLIPSASQGASQDASQESRSQADSQSHSQQNVPLSCDDAKMSDSASQASDIPYLPLLSQREEREGEPPDTPPAEGAYSSLASLAPLASTYDLASGPAPAPTCSSCQRPLFLVRPGRDTCERCRLDREKSLARPAGSHDGACGCSVCSWFAEAIA
jgi:energy-coupling factor transporter ATP-binding protein EcfA2